MVFRLALPNDLQAVQTMYRDIVAQMNAQNICIWDEEYPHHFFAADIANERLYLLVDDAGAIMAACALCESAAPAGVAWKDDAAKALYLNRLGVRTTALGKGFAAEIVQKLQQKAQEKGAQYLRLLVVGSNAPALALYEKLGFERCAGVYEETIVPSRILYEYGFEKAL